METSFVIFLRGSYFFSSHAPHVRDSSRKGRYDRQLSEMRTRAQDWAGLLDELGFNLCQYGFRENQLLKESGQLGTRWESHISDNLSQNSFEWIVLSTATEPKLLELRYGPRPEDWNLIWDMDIEELACDFWEMIDEMPLPMPGAWVDD